MKTIYLHIGRGKTGTKTIRRFLATRRAALLKQGIYYVRADGGAKGVGHQEFGKSFIRELPEYMTAPRNPDGARRKIAAEIVRARADAVLISSEHLEMADPGEVRRFFNDLPIKCNVRVVFFVRSQDELAESEYNQLVKGRRLSRTFGSFLAQDLVGYDFMETAVRWETFFGRANLICRIYDSSEDVLEQFLLCLQLAVDPSLALSVRKAVNWNASLGFKALTVARILNSVDVRQRGRLNRMFYRWLEKKLLLRLSGQDMPALMFDSDQARAFRGRFMVSNEAFTGRFMNEAKSDLGGRKFSDQRRDVIRNQIKAMRLDSVGLEGFTPQIADG